MELGYAKHSAGSKQKHQNRQARTGFCSGAFVLDLLANRHLERLDKILVMPSEHHLISWGRETRALLLTGALSAENRADAPRKLGQAEMEVRRLRRFDAAERAYEARLDREFQDYYA